MARPGGMRGSRVFIGAQGRGGYTGPMASENPTPFDSDRGSSLPALDEPNRDIFALTRQAVREVDRLAVEQYGIPSVVLMENAAFHLADVALHLTGEDPGPRVLVVC